LKKLSITVCLFAAATFSQAQSINITNANVEEQVNNILKQMTLEEKIDYIGGVNNFYIRGIKRLNIPEMVMSDGPVGVVDYGKSTGYPAGILGAASWDTALVKQLGIALGKDARARNVNILLAPGVNIYRAPMCGRNFEYFGEDPYLASRMAVNYIKGVQSQRVAATVKHFAGNNQEWDRHNTSSNIDERTLQEIYLPPFKAAVTEANVACVMNSYNLVDGIHASQNAHLNIDILKNSWHFRGLLMSDWVSVYDGIEAAKNGLDLEMPSAEFMNKATLLPAIKNGTISEKTINDKVRRILRVIFTFGFNDNKQLDNSIAKDNAANANTALNVARGGIVLLKNEHNVLPLKGIKTLAVIGANGDSYIAGGGSSYLTPFQYTSLQKGLQDIVGNNVKIQYVAFSSVLKSAAENSVFYSRTAVGLQAAYFKNDSLGGTPDFTRIEKTVDHHWDKAPDVAGFAGDHFSVRWTGSIKPTKTDNYKFTVRGDDGYRLWVNDKLILDEWHDQAALTRSKILSLEADKSYDIKLEYFENAGNADITLAWGSVLPDLTAVIDAAKNADAVIIEAGFNGDTEGEGRDRTFELPEPQTDLINAIAKGNKKTIVVLNAGGNVDMQAWLPNIQGLLHAWYAGQEGGTAIAEILFGKVNPSGKLPASFEKQWKDNPVYNSYYDINNSKNVTYTEGLFVGYRYYDTSNIKPQFPFGFGLSYTTFLYSNLSLRNLGSINHPKLMVSFNVKNTGDKDGAEVAQVYIHQNKCNVIRPTKELKGFTKVFLKKGETKRVTVELGDNAFSYYKTALKQFGYDAGKFNIIIGASSVDIRLQKEVMIK
jgi:beta-glucosidase